SATVRPQDRRIISVRIRCRRKWSSISRLPSDLTRLSAWISRMPEHVVVEHRFRGPPELGQGGYACGLVAEHIDAPVATVSLRRPVPLETPLKVRSIDQTVELR